MRKYLVLFLCLALCLPMEAGKVKGKVTANGKGVAGVPVSDGRSIVLTDAHGRYLLETDKADSIVFITTPSGYVAKAIDPIRPGFWQLLDKPADKPEKHDFTLVPQNQDKYSVVFFTDTHFASDPSRNDLETFKATALPVISSEVGKAAAKGAVYAANLGDFAHDLYWYDFGMNEMEAEKFLASTGLKVPVYAVTGNHDNDAGLQNTGENTDFLSAWCYRHTWGPGCYSVNIGGDHWIFLDSVVYENLGDANKKHRNMKGGRSYRCRLAASYIDWLAADVKLVPEGTRVFVCTHVPFINDASKTERIDQTQLDTLDTIFSKFANVTVFSGHTHKAINPKSGKYLRFKQYIFGATSGNMWKNPEGTQIVGIDGSEQGINVLDCTGKQPEVRYVSIENGSKLFRTYDMNAVGDWYRSDECMKNLRKYCPERTDYSNSKYHNCVFVNCWGMRPGWRIEVMEGGRSLEVSKVKTDDPIYVATYVAPKFKDEAKALKASGSEAKDKKNAHLWCARTRTAKSEVTVRLLDENGSIVEQQTLSRPKAFNQSAR